MPLKEQVEAHVRRHNTSLISRWDAMKIVGTEAVGWRMDNVDYIVGVSLADDGSISLTTYTPEGAKAVI